MWIKWINLHIWTVVNRWKNENRLIYLIPRTRRCYSNSVSGQRIVNALRWSWSMFSSNSNSDPDNELMDTITNPSKWPVYDTPESLEWEMNPYFVPPQPNANDLQRSVNQQRISDPMLQWDIESRILWESVLWEYRNSSSWSTWNHSQGWGKIPTFGIEISKRGMDVRNDMAMRRAAAAA